MSLRPFPASSVVALATAIGLGSLNREQLETVGHGVRSIVRGATRSEEIVVFGEAEGEPECEPCPEGVPPAVVDQPAESLHRRLFREAMEAEDPRLEMAMGLLGAGHWLLGRLLACLLGCRRRGAAQNRGRRLRLT